MEEILGISLGILFVAAAYVISELTMPPQYDTWEEIQKKHDELNKK